MLRALRAGLHGAGAARERGLHARPGGEPLHDGLARLELHLARVALPRPDRAAGRRAADDRRRVPPALAADHAAGVPPRADRRVDRRDDRGDGARPGAAGADAAARPAGGGRGGRPLPLDAAPGDADRDAGAVRPRSGPGAGAGDRCGRPLRAGAVVLRERIHVALPARPAHAVGAPAGRRAAPGPRDLRRDRAAARNRGARRGRAEPAAGRERRGGRRRSATARSATR